MSHFEGQAAIELEFAADRRVTDCYPFTVDLTNEVGVIDTPEMVKRILTDHRGGVSCSTISARFHNTMAETIVRIAKMEGQKKIALSGGCFQNKFLTELVIERLRSEGFDVYWHQRVPPNDGGIALGQLAALAAVEKREDRSCALLFPEK